MRQRVVISLVAATALVHLGVGLARTNGWMTLSGAVLLSIAMAWAVIILLAAIASRRILNLETDLRVQQDQYKASLTQIEQLAALNEMLRTLGRATDVGLSFQSLAGHVSRLAPCDRLGLALLRESGQDVLTYSARVSEPERRRRPRPEKEFSLARSTFGQVIRSCEIQVIGDLGQRAAEFQDASNLSAQGFNSALMLPLISNNRAIGVLTLASTQRAAFTAAHGEALQPLAEVLAFAFVAQQQQHALERLQMMASMSDTTFAIASEINGALQGVIGEASMLRRKHPELSEGLDAVVAHAERTLGLLERMRAAARDRLTEADLTAAIPASPEDFGPDENY